MVFSDSATAASQRLSDSNYSISHMYYKNSTRKEIESRKQKQLAFNVKAARFGKNGQTKLKKLINSRNNEHGLLSFGFCIGWDLAIM